MGKELPLSPDTPAILGMDFAGTVEAVGEGVSGYSVGDEVYGCAGGLADLPGTLAEYITADANLIAHKAKNLSMREAAALPLVAITAFEGLTRAGIGSGQKVLVHGGSGGVGHIAVQLAKHWGAEVYSTGGGDPQLALIRETRWNGYQLQDRIRRAVRRETHRWRWVRSGVRFGRRREPNKFV